MRRTISVCTTIASLLTLFACNNTIDATPNDEDDDGPGGRAAGSAGKYASAGRPGLGGEGGKAAAPSGGKGGETPDVPDPDPVVGGTGGAPDDGYAGEGGGAAPVLAQPSRGSAVALSPDESLALVANRDVGSVTLLGLDRSKPGAPPSRVLEEIPLGQGSEPWQVAFAPDGETAFVVLRRDQRLARIRYLTSKPVVDARVQVGSEPTGVALSPTGELAFVANWSDGTVTVVETKTMKRVRTIDLNGALVAGGYLGEIAPRAALAKPRSLTVSNDLDAEDADETLYVTEFYAQQREPEAADGSNSDVRNVGVVYKTLATHGRLGRSPRSSTTAAREPIRARRFAACNPPCYHPPVKEKVQ
jgi:hypothetical protein